MQFGLLQLKFLPSYSEQKIKTRVDNGTEKGEHRVGPVYTMSHSRNMSRVSCGLSNLTVVTAMHHAMQGC
jgi:hypothetical protein